MRKLTMFVVSLLMMSGVASAQQQSKSDETLEFRPHWSLRAQGGAGYTIGETSFGELLSPAAQISAAYNFHPAMGVRVGLSGWQAKGAVVVADDYSFNYAQLSADYVLDLANLIGGFKHDRICSPYIFAGIGGAYTFNNKEAEQIKNENPGSLLNFNETLPFFVGRAGAGVDFWVAKNLSLGLEANANCYSDKFNSKKAFDDMLADWQFNALLGVKYRFGGNTRPSQAYADKVAAEEAARLAEEAAAKAEAERLAAEKAEAERLAAEKAEAERLAAEKAAAEKAAAEAAAHAAMAAENSQNVFFSIGSAVITKAEDKKLQTLAEWMKANPDFTVAVIGYADKGTGSAGINAKIADKRAKAVADRLVKLGVPAERVEVASYGDTQQPFEQNDKNRVVICTLE
ncbi:MAG: OmpA family protein [Bacteroidales bacterium]|nr:OmpA family protein [Bacteroidales bacterium]